MTSLLMAKLSYSGTFPASVRNAANAIVDARSEVSIVPWCTYRAKACPKKSSIQMTASANTMKKPTKHTNYRLKKDTHTMVKVCRISQSISLSFIFPWNMITSCFLTTSLRFPDEQATEETMVTTQNSNLYQDPSFLRNPSQDPPLFNNLSQDPRSDTVRIIVINRILEFIK